MERRARTLVPWVVLAFAVAFEPALAEPLQGGAARTTTTPSGPVREAPRPRPLRVCVIGDYGDSGQPEADVAALVHAFEPDYVLTLGDNNYPDGEAATIDANVGQYYQRYIAPYTGSWGPGASTNRFFPALGNHDWIAPGAQPYLDYFELPGNERYYEKRLDPSLHVFVLDSEPSEPDGITEASVQGQWLQAALAASDAPFKLVTLHHPPYSSGIGEQPLLRWPYAAWGADAVLAAHEHFYERLSSGGLPYFINGAGGRSLYTFSTPDPASVVRFNGDYGALLIELTDTLAVFRFVTRAGTVVDTFGLPPEGLAGEGPARVLVPRGARWRYLDGARLPAPSWRRRDFDDAGWAVGPAPLGRGLDDVATLVRPGPDAGRSRTTWFRHRFERQEEASPAALLLRIRGAGGVLVHLNGVEVHRSNLPYGRVGSTTPAASASLDHGGYVETSIDPAALVAGENVLAVEVHRASGPRAPLALDLELVALP